VNSAPALETPCFNSSSIPNLQVKQRLEELQRQEGTPDVVVVGGGYAGIELASVAAEMLAGEQQRHCKGAQKTMRMPSWQPMAGHPRSYSPGCPALVACQGRHVKQAEGKICPASPWNQA
jgi:hypothetical protein